MDKVDAKKFDLYCKIRDHTCTCYYHYNVLDRYRININSELYELEHIHTIILEYHHRETMKYNLDSIYTIAGLLGETMGDKILAPYFKENPCRSLTEPLTPKLLGGIAGISLMYAYLNPNVPLSNGKPIRFDIGG